MRRTSLLLAVMAGVLTLGSGTALAAARREPAGQQLAAHDLRHRP